MRKQVAGVVLLFSWAWATPTALGSQSQGTPTAQGTGVQNQPVEWAYQSQKTYHDPFNEVDVDVIFTRSDGGQWKVPAFRAGGNQ